MDKLREMLLKYKEITNDMICSINDDKEDAFKKLIIDKQALMNAISEIGYESKEFKLIASEFQLLEQDEKLHKLIEEKKLSIKEEIRQINEKKTAMTAYNNFYRGFNLINKKI